MSSTGSKLLRILNENPLTEPRGGVNSCPHINSNVRMDLPPTGIGFDKYRQEYRDLALAAKEIQKRTTTLIVTENTEGGNSILTMLENHKQSKGILSLIATGRILQELCEYSTTYDQGSSQGASYIIPRRGDMLNAFYFPSDLSWVKLNVNGITNGFYQGSTQGKSLDQILAEARQIPEQVDNLELLLELSRKGKIGFIHKQEDQIVISGVTYDRYILIQPFIPLISLTYSCIKIISSEPCKFYVESNYLDVSRSVMASSDFILYAEDQEYPLLCVVTGMMAPIYSGSLSSPTIPFFVDEYGNIPGLDSGILDICIINSKIIDSDNII